MSDLAPFVAATLRDKVVSELLQENRKLREEKRALEYVEITGPNHQPVYARGHLRDDEFEIGGQITGAFVQMHDLTLCPLQQLGSIEVWVRNCFSGKFRARSARLFFPRNEMLVVAMYATRPEEGPAFAIEGVKVRSDWTRRDLETYARDYPSIQRLLDGIDADAASTPPMTSLSAPWFRTLIQDLSEIDPTKLCTFVGVVLRKEEIIIGLD